MRIFQSVLIGAVLFCTLCPVSGEAEEIVAATCDWPPYIDQNLPEYGFTGELLTEVFERAGMTLQLRFLPWKRAVKGAEAGYYDALVSAYDIPERQRTFGVSNPYAGSTEVFATVSEGMPACAGESGLSACRVGAVRGYTHVGTLRDRGFKVIDEAVDDAHNLGKLAGGRVPAAVVDKNVALWLVKNKPDIFRGRTLHFLSPPFEAWTIHAMFSKQKPGWEDRLARFNRALAEVQQDGTAARIIHRHGYEPQLPVNLPPEKRVGGESVEIFP